MALLDNLKNNNTTGDNKMTNPLLAALKNKNTEAQTTEAKPNPLLAAMQAKKPAETTEAKPNPLLASMAKKEEPKAEPEVAETPVEETPQEPAAEPTQEVSESKEPEQKVDTPEEAPVDTEKTATEAKEEPKEEPKEEATPEVKEAPKEDQKPAPKEEAKEEVKEEPKAEKPAPKKNTRKRGGSKTTPQSESDTEVIEVPRTAVGFDQAMNSLQSQFQDKEWDDYKASVQAELNSIQISQDMNPGTLKITLQELSIIREKLWLPLQEYKVRYENMTSREPEGLIEQIKRVNVAGGNETDRRKAGVLAAMHHKTPDGTEINLFEVAAELRDRYGFLRAAMEHVKYKTDVLITMSGALKLESNHTN